MAASTPAARNTAKRTESLRRFLRPTAPAVVLALLLGACRPSPRHPQPDAAVDRCRRVLATLPVIAPDRRFESVAGECADLFQEPRCQLAWREAQTLAPELRAETMVEACREAYCPVLKAPPRPARSSSTRSTIAANRRSRARWTSGPSSSLRARPMASQVASWCGCGAVRSR